MSFNPNPVEGINTDAPFLIILDSINFDIPAKAAAEVGSMYKPSWFAKCNCHSMISFSETITHDPLFSCSAFTIWFTLGGLETAIPPAIVLD